MENKQEPLFRKYFWFFQCFRSPIIKKNLLGKNDLPNAPTRQKMLPETVPEVDVQNIITGRKMVHRQKKKTIARTIVIPITFLETHS